MRQTAGLLHSVFFSVSNCLYSLQCFLSRLRVFFLLLSNGLNMLQYFSSPPPPTLVSCFIYLQVGTRYLTFFSFQSDFFLTGIHIWQFFLSSLPNVTFLLKFLPPSSRSFFSPTLFVILKPKHDLSTTDWMCVYTFSSSSSTCVYLLLSAVNILVTYFSY